MGICRRTDRPNIQCPWCEKSNTVWYKIWAKYSPYCADKQCFGNLTSLLGNMAQNKRASKGLPSVKV